MNKEMFSRSTPLIGEDNFVALQDKTIFIAGLGGVGGTAFEALVRTGVKKFIIVDKDVVALSNLNRQLLYVASDVNKAKVEVAKSRAQSINDEVEIIALQDDIKNIGEIKADFIVDCIDDVNAKVYLIKYALEHNIPLITSMGMANKIDPSKIKISSLNKSTVDPLAKKMRYELKQANVDYSKVMCCYSDESPIKDGNKLHSLMMVTSTAGLHIANYVVQGLKRN